MASSETSEYYLDGLITLARLPDDSFQELRAVLESSAPSKFGPRTIAELATKVKSIPNHEAEDIIFAVFGTALGRASGARIEKAAETVTGDFEDDFEEAGLPPEAIEQLKSRLTTLYNLNSIRIGGKAYELIVENAHNFQTARILTDVRPVFDENISGSPNSALILHLLRITYSSDLDDKEFYVTLETNELQEVIQVLERAKAKAEALKSVLAAADMTYIGE